MINDIAEMGASKLISLIVPPGRFIYRYSAADGAIDKGYNIVRHAGALWSILKLKRQLSEQDLRLTLLAMWWLWNHALEVDGAGFLIRRGLSKLGADALMLLTVSELLRRDLDPLNMWKPIGSMLARGILHRRTTDDKDFVHKIALSTGKALPFRSEYYTGEALYALFSWVAHSPFGSSVMEPATIILRAKTDEDYGIKQNSHWMAYALAEYQKLIEGPQEAWVADYAIKLTHAIINNDTYRKRWQTTPVTIRVEALVALIPLLPASMRSLALDHAQADMDFAMQWYRPDGAVVRGAGSHEVRIDYIQHLITAWQGLKDARERTALWPTTMLQAG